MNDYILIEYSNSVDFSDIVYHNTFTNKVYIDADVSKPEYEIVEEGIENDDGEFDPTFQKWAKKYSLRFYAQEFLVDALTLMSLHDNIRVTLKNGESSKVIDVEVTPKWDSNIECWAELDISFVTDYVIRKKCDENMTSCSEAIVVADDVYEYDDGGAGQSRWESTSIADGIISFFYGLEIEDRYYTATSGESLPGFYVANNGAWELIEMESGQFGDVTAFDSDESHWIVKVTDTKYVGTPILLSVTDQAGGVAKLRARSDTIESTFFQVQYYTALAWHDIGDPAMASAFSSAGLEITAVVGTYAYRLKWYTHSCEYGYSNDITATIT